MSPRGARPVLSRLGRGRPWAALSVCDYSSRADARRCSVEQESEGRYPGAAPAGILRVLRSFSLGSGRNRYGGDVETGSRRPIGVNLDAEENCCDCFWSRSSPVSPRRPRPDRPVDGARRGGAEDGNSPPPSPHAATTHAPATDGTPAPASRCHRSCTVNKTHRELARVPIEASKTPIEFAPWRSLGYNLYTAAGLFACL